MWINSATDCYSTFLYSDLSHLFKKHYQCVNVTHQTLSTIDSEEAIKWN